MCDSQTGDFVTSFLDKVTGNRIRRHFLLTDFQWMIPWEPIATWSGVDFTLCCGSLFVVERITVTDLVANKISGSGSCLIGKLQNSPHNCEASSCPASRRQKGNHKIHKTTYALYFTLSQLLQLWKADNKVHYKVILPFSWRVMSFYRAGHKHTHNTDAHTVTQSWSHTLRSICNV